MAKLIVTLKGKEIEGKDYSMVYFNTMMALDSAITVNCADITWDDEPIVVKGKLRKSGRRDLRKGEYGIQVPGGAENQANILKMFKKALVKKGILEENDFIINFSS